MSDETESGWPEEDPAISGDPLGLSALFDDEEGSAEDKVVADVPTADSVEDLAELAEVEADLDTRWPETKIEPSLTRISTLMDLLGSPQHELGGIEQLRGEIARRRGMVLAHRDVAARVGATSQGETQGIRAESLDPVQRIDAVAKGL